MKKILNFPASASSVLAHLGFNDKEIITDGRENATSSANECGGFTIARSYGDYESNSWQYKLRNKLLTGNTTGGGMRENLLLVSVDLIFTSFITGESPNGTETSGQALTPFVAQPTIHQAFDLYGGLTDQTGGSFKAITVAANGQVVSRRPGDVDKNGCVDTNDVNIINAYWGQPASATHPSSFDSDLDGNGWVDIFDYLLFIENWQKGCGQPSQR